jgi:hypothetical protein
VERRTKSGGKVSSQGDWRIAGKPKGTLPEIGKKYKVIHTRKGEFWMRATAVSGEWLTGTITDGIARAVLYYNEREEGEEITVRDTLCTLVECPEGETVTP